MNAYFLIISILVLLASSNQKGQTLVRIKVDSTVNLYQLTIDETLKNIGTPLKLETLTIDLSDKKEFLLENKKSTFIKIKQSGSDKLYLKEGDFKLEFIDENYEDGVNAKDPKDLAFKLDMPDRRVQSALTQNIYSRALIYFPNEQVVNEIQKLAQIFYKLIKHLKEQPSTTKKLRTRKIHSTSEQLLNLLSFQILSNKENAGFLAGKSQEYLFKVIEKVATNKEIIKTEDRVIVLLVLADIANLYLFKDPETIAVKDHAINLIEKIQYITGNKYMNMNDFNKIKEINGLRVNGVEKQKERVNHPEIKYAKTGIYGLGSFADDIIDSFLPKQNQEILKKINNEKEFNPQGNKLKPIIWPYYTLPVWKIIGSYGEALSGHISGRPGEIHFIWDCLLGNNPLKPYVDSSDGKEETEDRKKLRVGILSALYISIGYHSAVEYYEGSLKYLKESIRGKEKKSEPQSISQLHHKNEDSSYLHYYGKATEFFINLFQNYMIIQLPIIEIQELINKKEFLEKVKDFLSKETEKTSKEEEKERQHKLEKAKLKTNSIIKTK